MKRSVVLTTCGDHSRRRRVPFWGFKTKIASRSKVKSKSEVKNYFIVRPKVDQRAGQLTLPHLGFFKNLN